MGSALDDGKEMKAIACLPVATPPRIECECKHHCLVHPTSGNYPRCQYDGVNPLWTTPKKDPCTLDPPPYIEKEIVMEDGDFFIEKYKEQVEIDNGDKHESWVMHYCPTFYWKVFVNEHDMIKYGMCDLCNQVIPPGLIALWKLHNWEVATK